MNKRSRNTMRYKIIAISANSVSIYRNDIRCTGILLLFNAIQQVICQLLSKKMVAGKAHVRGKDNQWLIADPKLSD